MIITFYSFKGGLGRSMALANVAEILYHRGLRVLVIDWDLEAPGLDQFFKSVAQYDMKGRPGLIDMLVAYKQWGIKPPGDIIDPPPAVRNYVQDIYPPDGNGACLKLISAGKRDATSFEQYTNWVKNFDWKDFYENWEGERYLEWVRTQLDEIADVVLIDSRTGVTEMGNVCIYHLADLVVSLTSASRQSLEGTTRMLRTFESPRVEQVRAARPLRAIVVPARVEDKAELASYNVFKQEFSRLFDEYCPQKWHDETQQTLWDLKIPYVPLYAFEELVAVRQAGTEQASDLLERAFSRLVGAIDYVIPLPRPGPRRVLIIEDNRSWQDLLGELLLTSGHEVDFADSAQDGIHKLQQNSYTLMLLNLNLRGEMEQDYEGLNILQWIKEQEPETHNSDIPVIIITGSPISVTQLRRWPMVKDIIVKGVGVTPDRLRDGIRDLLSQSMESPSLDTRLN